MRHRGPTLITITAILGLTLVFPGASAAAAQAVLATSGAQPTRVLVEITPMAEKDGHCNRDIHGNGELCFWWGYGFSGSGIDFFFEDSDLSDNTFITAGPGQGVHVDNNTRSLWNYDLNKTAWVCDDDSPGPDICAPIPPNRGGNHDSYFIQNIDYFYWTPPR